MLLWFVVFVEVDAGSVVLLHGVAGQQLTDKKSTKTVTSWNVETSSKTPEQFTFYSYHNHNYALLNKKRKKKKTFSWYTATLQLEGEAFLLGKCSICTHLNSQIKTMAISKSLLLTWQRCPHVTWMPHSSFPPPLDSALPKSEACARVRSAMQGERDSRKSVLENGGDILPIWRPIHPARQVYLIKKKKK